MSNIFSMIHKYSLKPVLISYVLNNKIMDLFILNDIVKLIIKNINIY